MCCFKQGVVSIVWLEGGGLHLGTSKAVWSETYLEKSKQTQQMQCLEVEDVLRRFQTQQGIRMKHEHIKSRRCFVLGICGPNLGFHLLQETYMQSSINTTTVK